MNNGLIWRGILIAILAVGMAAAIGVSAYNAGVAQGIAESGRVVAAPAPAPGAPSPYIYPYGWHRHGGGFFPFFPFFGVLFTFLILRALWWRGPMYRGWDRGYGYGPPPADRRPDEAHPRS